MPSLCPKCLLQPKLFDNSCIVKCRKRLEYLIMAKLRLNWQNIAVPKAFLIQQLSWSSIAGKADLLFPVTTELPYKLPLNVNIFHSHTQESYHQVLPLTYHTSYNTSYHSIHAPFRVKVTSFHELPLNF